MLKTEEADCAKKHANHSGREYTLCISWSVCVSFACQPLPGLCSCDFLSSFNSHVKKKKSEFHNLKNQNQGPYDKTRPRKNDS